MRYACICALSSIIKRPKLPGCRVNRIFDAPLNLYFNKGCVHVVGEWVISKHAMWHITDFNDNAQFGSDDVELERLRGNYMFTRAIDDAIKKEGNSVFEPRLLYHDENIVVTDQFFVIGRDAYWGDFVKDILYTDKPINSLRVVLKNGRSLEHRSMLSKTIPEARDALQEMVKTPILEPHEMELKTITAKRHQTTEAIKPIQEKPPVESKTSLFHAEEDSIQAVLKRDSKDQPSYQPTDDERTLDLMGREVDYIDVIEIPSEDADDEEYEVEEEDEADYEDETDEESEVSDGEFDELIRKSEDELGYIRSGVDIESGRVIDVRPPRRPLYDDLPIATDGYGPPKLKTGEVVPSIASDAQDSGEKTYYSGAAGTVTSKRIRSPHGYWLMSVIKNVEYAELPWHMQPGVQTKIVTGIIIFVVLLIIAPPVAFIGLIIYLMGAGKKMSLSTKGVVTFTLYTGTKAYIVDKPEYNGELQSLADAVKRALLEKKL